MYLYGNNIIFYDVDIGWISFIVSMKFRDLLLIHVIRHSFHLDDAFFLSPFTTCIKRVVTLSGPQSFENQGETEYAAVVFLELKIRYDCCCYSFVVKIISLKPIQFCGTWLSFHFEDLVILRNFSQEMMLYSSIVTDWIRKPTSPYCMVFLFLQQGQLFYPISYAIGIPRGNSKSAWLPVMLLTEAVKLMQSNVATDFVHQKKVVLARVAIVFLIQTFVIFFAKKKRNFLHLRLTIILLLVSALAQHGLT